MYVSGIAKDITYAWRSLVLAPVSTLTIVATVGIGLGLVTSVFTIYNALFLRADAVWNPQELVVVQRPTRPAANSWLPFFRWEYDALRTETTVFAGTAAVRRNVTVRVDGSRMTAALVTGSFFKVLGGDAIKGRALNTLDDGRSAGDPVMVLSSKGARRLGNDIDLVGRSVRVNGFPYRIVGIMPEGFRGLTVVPPDFWASLSLAEQLGVNKAGKEGDVEVEVIGRLKPAMLAKTARAALTVWASQRPGLRKINRRQAAIRLVPSNGTFELGLDAQLVVIVPVFVAFGLILMIGCANVANMLLARGLARQREIGIRLSIGASRWRIVRQALVESFLLAIAAAACGLLASRLLFAAIQAVVSMAPPDIAEQLAYAIRLPVDWRVVLFLLATALMSVVFFGLVPAFQALPLEIVRTMRGDVIRDGRPLFARSALIAAQVGAATMLLTLATVFLRGTLAAARMDPGIRTQDTVVVPLKSEARRTAILQELNAQPAVAIVAASAPGVLGPYPPTTTQAVSTSREAPAGYQFVSSEYFDTLGVAVRGRRFSAHERSYEPGVVILSERLAARLWPGRLAVGESVRFQVDPPLDARSIERSLPGESSSPSAPESNASRSTGLTRTYEVVGVVPAVTVGASMMGPDLYLPTDAQTPGTTLLLRVRGNPEWASRHLLDRLVRIDPGTDQIIPLRRLVDRLTYVLGAALSVSLCLSGLALFLTVSGLLSVLSFVVEQRTPEIGLRLALGATRVKVVTLILRQSFRAVGAGILLGGGTAAALAVLIRSTTVLSDEVVRIVDPLAYVASTSIIALACIVACLLPSMRAAATNPAVTLKHE